MEKIDWPELHRLNGVWRRWMDAHSQFVTPDTLDSLRYCRIEANEAADLELRAKLPSHVRNNERNHTIPGELAQAVMLALTALPKIDFETARRIELYAELMDVSPLVPPIDRICHLASTAVLECAQGYTSWPLAVHAMLDMIAAYPGVNVETDLRKCWLALAWKHASYHMAQYPEELKP